MASLQERLRQDNLRQILDLLRRHNGISQVDLVRETGLRPSTVSNLVRELREGGYIQVVGRGESGQTGGKPPVMLALEPQRGLFLGLMWDSGRIGAIVVDFTGSPVTEPVFLSIREIAGGQGNAGVIMGALEMLARGRIAQATATTASVCGAPQILGVGLAVGSIVGRDGVIRPSADFPWQLGAPVEKLRTALGLPKRTVVVVENDANCVALDVRRRLSDVPETILALVITADPVSVGAGLMVRDLLVRGREGATGELLEERRLHTIEHVDSACATVIRMVDPDYLAVALPDQFTLGPLTRTRQAIGSRPVKILQQSRAPLLGVSYFAHRAAVEQIVQGGEEREAG